ncbi:MAG: pyridoxal-phosphate dependent enzyme [Bacillota bacterium]|nr:pyridoxal-phosphate dependent enzyme [Bacillota bacterium]
MVKFDDVVLARRRIRDYIYLTPLELSLSLSSGKTKVFLKLECQQRLKSFKIRGALSKVTMLSEEKKSRGILAVSSGNHGAAVSYAANIFGGIETKVFVPKGTPESKVKKISFFGAQVNTVGDSYDETHAIAMEVLRRENQTYIDPCSDVEVIAGQGTVALEILEQHPDIDTIVAPIGGGGLITGLGLAAKSIKPGVQIIGVQTRACPAMVHALRDGVCYAEYASAPSICDAVIGGVGEIPFSMAGECIDNIIEVDESTVARAVAQLMKQEKVIAEPSGALGVAAFMEQPQLFEGKNAAIVISGGNLDGKLMRELIMRE